MLMTRTSDVGAIAERLENLYADGNTALHDAVVTSLYYYRGISGRRMLVLLSDGEDTASSLRFDEALEYAKRSGVAIYTIGLNIGRTDVSVRGKLNKLAEETGGRTFFIRAAEELRRVYAEIEREFRSQYLLAYESDQRGDRTSYREVNVEIDGGNKARTIKGYYP
jgi:VWFA-related protein